MTGDPLLLGVIGPSCEDHSRILSMLHKVAHIIKTNGKWQNKTSSRHIQCRIKDIFNLMDGIVMLPRLGIEDLNQSALKILGKKARGYKSAVLEKIFAGKDCFDLMLTQFPFSNVELLLDCSSAVHCWHPVSPAMTIRGILPGAS